MKMFVSNTTRNGLCPCEMMSNIPVKLTGATTSNVTIGPNAIKRSGLGTVTRSRTR